MRAREREPRLGVVGRRRARTRRRTPVEPRREHAPQTPVMSTRRQSRVPCTASGRVLASPTRPMGAVRDGERGDVYLLPFSVFQELKKPTSYIPAQSVGHHARTSALPAPGNAASGKMKQRPPAFSSIHQPYDRPRVCRSAFNAFIFLRRSPGSAINRALKPTFLASECYHRRVGLRPCTLSHSSPAIDDPHERRLSRN